MRPVGVVVATPASDVELGVFARQEPALIEAFVAPAPVEALDVAALDGVSRLDLSECDVAISGSCIERSPAKLAAIVNMEVA